MTKRSLWGEFVYETRRGAGRQMKLAGIALLVPAIILLVVFGVASVAAYREQSKQVPAAVNATSIPLNSYAAGVIEVFSCVHQGPAQCSNYTAAKEWLAGTSEGRPLTYRPLDPAVAPGKEVGNGMKEVSLADPALTEAQWHALAASITLDGAANPSTVTETTIEPTSSNGASFVVSAADGTQETGSLAFAGGADASTRVLVQVDYVKAG